MSNSYFSNKLLFTDRRESIDPILKAKRKRKLKKTRKKQRVRRNKKTTLASGLKGLKKTDILSLILDIMGKSQEKAEKKVLKDKKPRKMKLATLRGQGVSRGGYGLGKLTQTKEKKTPTETQSKQKKDESNRDYYVRLAGLYEGQPKLQEVLMSLSLTEATRLTKTEANKMIGRATGTLKGELENLSEDIIDFNDMVFEAPIVRKKQTATGDRTRVVRPATRAPQADIIPDPLRVIVEEEQPEPEPQEEEADVEEQPEPQEEEAPQPKPPRKGRSDKDKKRGKYKTQKMRMRETYDTIMRQEPEARESYIEGLKETSQRYHYFEDLNALERYGRTI